MKKLLLTLACILSVIASQAGETVYKTLQFGSAYNSEALSSYTKSWKATCDGFTWDVVNFNNNNNDWDYVKCGSKNNASVASLTTSTAIDKAVTRVDLTIDAITATNVNSIKLYVSSTSDFSGVEGIEITKAKGVQSVTIPTPTENKFYKIEFDCKKSSNGVVQVSKVEYFIASAKDDVEMSFSETSVSHTLGQAFVAPTLTTTPANLSVTYSSSNTAVATVDETTGVVTILAKGTTNITASFAGNDNYNAGSATYTLNVYKTIPSDCITVTITKDDFTSVSYDDNYGDHTVTASNGQNFVFYCNRVYQNSNAMQWQKNTGVIYNRSDLGKITRIEITATDNNLTILDCSSVGNSNTDGTKINPVGSNPYIYDFSEENSYFTITTGILSKTSEIKIYILPGDPTDPKIIAPATLDFGKSLNTFEPKTINITGENLSEEISFNWAEGANFSCEGTLTSEGGSLTITPTATTVGKYNDTLTLTSGTISTRIEVTAEIIALAGTGAGTEANPYDVTRAIAYIDTFGSISDVCVKGTISKIDKFNETYGSITYWLDNDTFEVYGGLNIEGTQFSSIDDLIVGDEVVVRGNIKKYGSIYEFDKDNYLVSITKATATDKLTSITISGEYPTEFNINDAFSHEGLVVTATYTISEDKDVTADAVVDAPDMTTKGTKTVTVSYTEGETTVTKTYTINVVDPNVTYVMLVGKAQNGKYYAVSNETGKGTKSLAAVEVVVVNNKVLTNEVNDNLLWMVDGANIVSKNGTYLSSGTDNANLSTSDTAFEWKWVEDGGYWANGDRPILGIDDEKGNYYFKAYAKSNIGKHVNNNGYYFATPAVEMAYEIADVTTEGEHTIIDVVVEDASTLPDNHIAKDNNDKWVANKIVINDEKGHGLNREVVANNVEYLRELSGEAWSAICLPFDVDATTLEDYAVLELQGVENGMVVFAYAEAMAAHTPYLICKKDNSENGNVDFKLANTTVKSAAAAEKTTSTAKMVGVYTAKRIPAGCYGLAGGVFRKAADDNDNELKPFRAYLVLTNAPQGAQMMSISIDDQATGIENINIADEVIFYDLQGRRVNNPSKGIFIMNGKKVIIK